MGTTSHSQDTSIYRRLSLHSDGQRGGRSRKLPHHTIGTGWLHARIIWQLYDAERTLVKAWHHHTTARQTHCERDVIIPRLKFSLSCPQYNDPLRCLSRFFVPYAAKPSTEQIPRSPRSNSRSPAPPRKYALEYSLSKKFTHYTAALQTSLPSRDSDYAAPCHGEDRSDD